jgi:hypothetical protein
MCPSFRRSLACLGCCTRLLLGCCTRLLLGCCTRLLLGLCTRLLLGCGTCLLLGCGTCLSLLLCGRSSLALGLSTSLRLTFCLRASLGFCLGACLGFCLGACLSFRSSTRFLLFRCCLCRIVLRRLEREGLTCATHRLLPRCLCGRRCGRRCSSGDRLAVRGPRITVPVADDSRFAGNGVPACVRVAQKKPFRFSGCTDKTCGESPGW